MWQNFFYIVSKPLEDNYIDPSLIDDGTKNGITTTSSPTTTIRTTTTTTQPKVVEIDPDYPNDEGIDKSELATNEEKQSAILYQIIVMGEATKRLSP